MIPHLTRNERRVFSAVYLRPGIRLSQIAAITKLSRNGAECQVYHLEKMGLILSSTHRLPLPGQTAPLYLQRICVPAPWVLA